MNAFIILFLPILFGFTAVEQQLHEFHLSKCEVNYNPDTRSMRIDLHVFIDDLELALLNMGTDSLFLCTPREHPEADFHIASYLRENFKLYSDNIAVDFEFVGREITEDLAAIWCYFEFPDFPLSKEILVENTVLMELFDDQKNITSIRIPQKVSKYFLFNKSMATGKIQLP